MRCSQASFKQAILRSGIWVRQHPWIALALVACGIGLRVFAEVADELREGGLSAFDTTIIDVISPYHTPFLDHLAMGISALVIWPLIIVIVLPFVLYLLITRRYRVLFWTVVLPAFSAVMVAVLKYIFHRNRPLHPLVVEIGYSFPSGHATGSTVLYGLLGYIAWRYWVRSGWARLLVVLATVLMILLTGLSRIYLGVHYPSDVLAGWSAGACILFAGIVILESCRKAEK